MMEGFGRTFLALGSPVIFLAGSGGTAVLATMFEGPKRWGVLAAGPVLTLAVAVAPTWLVITLISPGEGSGFLLGAAAIAVFTMALTPYYLVLGGVGLWRMSRSPAEESRSG